MELTVIPRFTARHTQGGFFISTLGNKKGGKEMDWLVWNPDTEEIREEDGVADVVVGYAQSPEEAREVGMAFGMNIAIPKWAETSKREESK